MFLGFKQFHFEVDVVTANLWSEINSVHIYFTPSALSMIILCMMTAEARR
jgi:hypothetical protein